LLTYSLNTATKSNKIGSPFICLTKKRCFKDFKLLIKSQDDRFKHSLKSSIDTGLFNLFIAKITSFSWGDKRLNNEQYIPLTYEELFDLARRTNMTLPNKIQLPILGFIPMEYKVEK
jgi:hypothetical protein